MKIKIQNNNLREKTLEDGWKNVVDGNLAEIHDVTKTGIQIKWIKASQVFIKCNHCGELVNRRKKK